MTKAEPRGSHGVILVLTVATAVLATVLLIALSRLGAGGANDAEEIYSGIPQRGTTLGESDAPVTISVYEDFQCPFCGQFSREVFPKIVRNYVKAGKVKVVSRPLVFLGGDSLEAARAALAAGEQDLYWQYHSLLFERQGAENSGYVTDEFLGGLARNTPGLDVGKWNEERTRGAFETELKRAQYEARSSGVNSTPTLIVSGPGGERKLTGAKDFEEVSATIRGVDGS